MKSTGRSRREGTSEMEKEMKGGKRERVRFLRLSRLALLLRLLEGLRGCSRPYRLSSLLLEPPSPPPSSSPSSLPPPSISGNTGSTSDSLSSTAFLFNARRTPAAPPRHLPSLARAALGRGGRRQSPNAGVRMEMGRLGGKVLSVLSFPFALCSTKQWRLKSNKFPPTRCVFACSVDSEVLY
jgi:hypothetical protein